MSTLLRIAVRVVAMGLAAAGPHARVLAGELRAAAGEARIREWGRTAP